jgi:organic hydroperoxide reductase OsmC/OhrA
MGLQMKSACELCAAALEPLGEAWICSFECTYCPSCAAARDHACKNCGGELSRRPRRGSVTRKASGTAHHAHVSWQRGDATFTDRRYSRAHRWRFDGGVELRASSSPHVVPAPLSDPAAVDPEEAFIASLSSCHMLWFLDLAARAGVVIDRYEDHAQGLLIDRALAPLSDTGAPGAGASLALHPVLGSITLSPTVTLAPGSDATPELLARLHHAAHERCFLANAVIEGVQLVEQDPVQRQRP